MRTHPVNVAHLVCGLAFLGIAGCWALTEIGVVGADPGWVLPLVLVVAGAAGLVAAAAKGLRRPRPATSEPYRDPYLHQPVGATPDPAYRPGDAEPTEELDRR